MLPDIENPLWDEISKGVAAGMFTLSSTSPQRLDASHVVNLNVQISIYSPTISDPATLEYLYTALTGREVVIPDAGNGYWPWLLRQLGFNVTAFSRQVQNARWANPEDRVKRFGSLRSNLRKHSDKTLLMIHPHRPFKDVAETLLSYEGDHIILHMPRPYEIRNVGPLLRHWHWVGTFRQGVTLERDQRVFWEFRHSDTPRDLAWAADTVLLPALEPGSALVSA